MYGLSVCVCYLYVCWLNHAKTAERIEMPFGVLTHGQICPRNHVLYGGSKSDESILRREG